MFTALKKLLLIILALLQWLSPLVHAHVADDLQGAGLHIPGLEKYSVSPDEEQLQPLAEADLIITIASGVHDEPTHFDAGQAPDKSCCSYQISFFNQIPHQPINFSPHLRPLSFPAIVLSPLVPRAP
ncbi:MAG: hypothetical protein CVV13_04045 [Gammaproteobacteria bacterium HGW-Gammaproteobacteria-3]|nr:MAG: hypothetical protein CVV13_04045 [Gammaproteobacteria bacterium HGW-Gammaproteobacteria-3]